MTCRICFNLDICFYVLLFGRLPHIEIGRKARGGEERERVTVADRELNVGPLEIPHIEVEIPHIGVWREKRECVSYCCR